MISIKVLMTVYILKFKFQSKVKKIKQYKIY